MTSRSYSARNRCIATPSSPRSSIASWISARLYRAPCSAMATKPGSSRARASGGSFSIRRAAAGNQVRAKMLPDRPIGGSTNSTRAPRSASTATAASNTPLDLGIDLDRPERRADRDPQARRCRPRGRPDSPGRRAAARASRAGPAALITVSISAASSTVRVIGPRCATVPNGDSGQAGTRPKVGLSPTMPQKPAGMRIEPPPSVPTCRAPMPSAAATPAPPLDPPDVRDRFQGLRARWPSGLSVTPFQPNSGVVVLPSRTAPASRSRAVAGASSAVGG